MNEELQVGDTVAYLQLGEESKNYYGVVEALATSPYSWSLTDTPYVYVKFYATAENPDYSEHHYFGTSYYPLNVLIKIEPYRTCTTEERVLRKTKKLWNESNYVKKHPQFAY